MPDLSVIINSLNDNREAALTVRSIRETAGNDVEIVLVDDASDEPLRLDDKETVLIRHNVRAGVGPSRHVAAMHATSEYLLITDSHMRFEPGWLDRAMKVITGRPNTLHCGQCVGLQEGQMDMTKATSFYHGATINFYGKDQNDASAPPQILEGVWLPERKGEDDYHIPAPMGAAYFIPTEFYFHIGGLKMLKGWGSDEPLLALKVWLSGGEVRIIKSVRIGHKFRTGNAPYATERWMMTYNKLAILATCLPNDYARRLIAKFPDTVEFRQALGRMKEDGGQIAVERTHNQQIFQRSFEWYLKQFNIPFPA